MQIISNEKCCKGSQCYRRLKNPICAELCKRLLDKFSLSLASDSKKSFVNIPSLASDSMKSFVNIPSLVSDSMKSFVNRPSLASDSKKSFVNRPSLASDSKKSFENIQSLASDNNFLEKVLPSYALNFFYFKKRE
ncbi:MAG: hypothetical protein LBS54_07410 [Dysgonamonadaceae bacterium]|nr:hypothetical protein [Dysgonamonadaceae bacterium]